MTPTITLHVSDELYARRLRAIAAWWCLGSSALEPQALMRYTPLDRLREAGL
jgi:hypothetical protein